MPNETPQEKSKEAPQEEKTIEQKFDVPDTLTDFTALEDERYKTDFFISQKLRQPVTAVPTYIPKNASEQIVFYDTGGVRRLYVNIGGVWRFTLLT